MININTTGIFLGAIAFLLIIIIWLVIDSKVNKVQTSNLDDRLKKFDNKEEKKKEVTNKKKNFLERLQDNLNEAEIKMNIWLFIFINGVATVILYAITLAIFKQPLVGLAPLPFTIYFLPTLIINNKKNKVLDKFDEELVIVLRRMSSVLQSGSILQALEEVKDLKNLSRKMRIFLNEVHHYNRYGDSIEEAFYKAGKNLKSENLKIAIVSIDINKELGADLSSSLNEISKRIQKKQLAAKEAKSLIAQTVTVGNVLSVAPFVIIAYIAISNPSYFGSYLSNMSNQIIFMGLIFFMFVGIFIIQKGANQRVK